MKASNENNTIVATTLLSDVVWFSVDLGTLNAQIEETQREIVSTMAKFKALGFNAIQDGRRKNSTPKTGEYSYLAFAEISEKSFIGKKKAFADSKRMNYIPPTEKQIADFTKQIVQSVQCFLEHGIWVNNCGRDKQSALIAAGLIKPAKESKEKNKKGTRTPIAFDAKKIADGLDGKYTKAQLEQIIVELDKLIL